MKKTFLLLLAFLVGCGSPAYLTAWRNKIKDQPTQFSIPRDSVSRVWGRAAIWATRNREPKSDDLFISWTDYVGNRHSVARVAEGDSVMILLTYSAKESGSWGTEPMAKNERQDAAAFIQRAEDVEVYKANHQK